MSHASEEPERRYKMNRFVIMSLAFIVVMSVGLGYADNSSLHKVSTTTHNMEYNELGEVAKEVIIDFETGELTDEEEETEGPWIKIELVDDEDEAISSESYEIVAPDGNIRKGRLDANGQEEE